MRISIINGPNLNLLGERQPEVYGNRSFDDYLAQLQAHFPSVEFQYAQSNVEGELVTLIQEARLSSDAVVLNAAAYTHTSIAIADAVASISIPVIGVHISNIYQREEERHIDLLAKYCEACVFGFGLKGYEMAINYLLHRQENPSDQ